MKDFKVIGVLMSYHERNERLNTVNGILRIYFPAKVALLGNMKIYIFNFCYILLFDFVIHIESE